MKMQACILDLSYGLNTYYVNSDIKNRLTWLH